MIKVRKLSSDTKISKIIELIDNSENLKAGVQSKAERLADSIVPYSFLAFGLTLLFTRNVTKAVSVLMVDYSCAIKLSTPIAVISAIKEAADDDVTVKGGKYLEEYALADSIVVEIPWATIYCTSACSSAWSISLSAAPFTIALATL